MWNFVRKSWPSVHLLYFFTGLPFSFTHILYYSLCCFWKRLKERSLNSGKEIVTCAVPPFNRPFWITVISLWNMHIGIVKLFWWERWALVSTTSLSMPSSTMIFFFLCYPVQINLSKFLIITWKDLISTYFNMINALFILRRDLKYSNILHRVSLNHTIPPLQINGNLLSFFRKDDKTKKHLKIFL